MAPRNQHRDPITGAVTRALRNAGVIALVKPSTPVVRGFTEEGLVAAVLQAERGVIRSAGINRSIVPRASLELLARAAGETLAGDPVVAEDRSAELLVALSTHSPVASGNLASSWIDGRGSADFDPQTDTYTLNNAVAYARINDLGGDTGKNGATHINPSYYTAAAANAVGLDPDQVVWTDGPLSGARGVGGRGSDRLSVGSIFRAIAA